MNTLPNTVPAPLADERIAGVPFRTVFLESSDAILVLDGERRILEANPAACLLFESTISKMQGRTIDDLLDAGPEAMQAVWSELLTRGAAKAEYLLPLAQGTRSLECRYRATNESDRHVCLASDVTKRRRLEERRVEAERIDSLGRLAGGIAHDFNNLLTAIVGHTELLLEGRAENDEDRPHLEQVQQAGQRAAALTHQLLAYSRKQVLAPRTVDLNDVIGGMHAMLSRLVREDIPLAWRPAAQPVLVHVDPSQLEQIIVNLVLNARDAIAAEGRIRIEVAKVAAAEVTVPIDVRARAREYVRIRVSDSGAGISSEARAHLFEPFFSSDAQGRATGLGLASVYGIVRQSGGFIDVESELGQGTTFTMHFPAADPQPPAASATRKREGATETRETILLVEDEDAVRAVTSIILKRDGYRVLEASTPSKACEIFAQSGSDVDLLLTDVVMPEMNGPGLAQRLVGLRPQLRVMFMSGYVDVTSPFDTGNPNMAFVNKPFQPSTLLARVRDVLGRNKGVA